MDRNEINRPARHPHYQKKYRHAQAHKGLVRFELQVNAQAKARFDRLVAAAADDEAELWDPRRRIAKARAQIFEEITQGVVHEFLGLQDQIKVLKAEIQALSPSFFKTDQNDHTPLPQAIRALPDNPKQLKTLLAKSHRDAQHARHAANQYQRHADQYQALYDASEQYTMELEQRLQAQ